jgi:hypothetical protein
MAKTEDGGSIPNFFLFCQEKGLVGESNRSDKSLSFPLMFVTFVTDLKELIFFSPLKNLTDDLKEQLGTFLIRFLFNSMKGAQRGIR